MKTKNILLLAALFASFVLVGCKQETPFDTQSPDDAPLILKPYNESGTGSFTYLLANPDTPLYDSVTVTPSKYTTVNWYIDNVLVYTGVKINMYLLAGTYDLTIEAITQARKSTKRTGSVTVLPYETDPSADAAAGGRHLVPGVEMSISGSNLSQVATIEFTEDFYSTKVKCSVAPSAKNDASLTFTIPALEDGTYYVRLKDAAGRLYGADVAHIHNSAVVIDGYASFVPGEEWVLTGAKLQDVASVKVDDKVITEIVATTSTITLTAPEAEVGEHTLSILNKDGSSVLFVTDEGTVAEVTTIVSAETTLWEGPVVLDWNADLVRIPTATMAAVPVGSTILVYFEVPEAEYHSMRITTPWWGDNASDNLVVQFDVTGETPNPFTFEYDDHCKALVDEREAMSVVGFGVTINKITYK